MTTPAGPFDPDDVTWTRVSGRLARARITVTAVAVTVGLAVTVPVALLVGQAWSWVFPAVVAAIGLWAVWLIRRQVRAIAYAERVDDLLIRKGILFRSLVVVPYGRMQFVNVTAGPLAHRFRIASVQLHTAAVGTNATIDGLPPEEAARLRDRLASRGEARLAGL